MSDFFDRSRAHLFLLGVEPAAVLRAIDRHHRRFGLTRQATRPGEVRGARGLDIQDAWTRAYPGGTALALEDIQSVFELGWALSRALRCPVVASRALKYGDWVLKIYHDNDCALRFGDDDDRELAWVGRPLAQEGIAELVQSLGGDGSLTGFLEDVVEAASGGSAQPDRRDLEAGLSLPTLSVGYPDLGDDDGWNHWTWSR